MNRFIILLFVSLVFLFSGCISIVEVQQDAVYVSASGDDSNPGTKSSPVLTLNRAIDIAKNKSLNKIYVEKGSWVYNNNTTLNIPSDLEIKGGFDSSFLVQDGYSTLSGITLVIDGVNGITLNKIAVKDSNKALKINNSYNINVSDCKFYSNYSTSDGGAIAIWNSSDITISSSYIYNSYSEGYGGGIDIYRSSYVYILSSTITNCLADVDHNNYGSGGAISVSSSKNVTIKDNTLYDCGIPSISGANDSVISLYGSYIPGLRIKNNYIRGVSSLSSYGIYEEVNITNHEVVDNNFYSSKLMYPYYDYANGSLNITSLNNGQAGTSIATNNTWN
ncbi:MAG: right-handed parallel beta-helix repeat-containing protein [Brevinematia bacterium]